MSVLWYPVPGRLGLYVNRLGQVGRDVEGQILTFFGRNTVSGYLTNSYKGKAFTHHVVVALTFIGPKPGPKYEVNHKNKDRADNKPGNLEWVTKKQNMEHMFVTEGVPWVKHKANERRISDEDTAKLISEYGVYTMDELKKRYGIPKYLIDHIMKAHRTGLAKEHPRSKVKYLHQELTIEQRRERRRQIKNNKPE